MNFVCFDYSFENIVDGEDFVVSEVIVGFVGMGDLVSYG